MNQSTDQEFGYSQLFSILFVRRRLWFAGVSLSVIACAILLTMMKKNIYESRMQLIIEPNFEEEYNPEEATMQPSPQQREIDYATQLNLMRSNELLQQAADSIISDYPNLNVYRAKQSLGLSIVKEDEVETRIVSVSYQDTNPVRAQDFLQALQSVYQEYALKRQEQRLSNGLRTINKQLSEARKGLTNSQFELENFRQNQNLIDPLEQATALTDYLNQISIEKQAISSEYQESLAQYENILEQIELSPERAFVASRLSQSTRFQTLLDTLQQTELALAERQAIFADADLNVQKLMTTRQNQLDLLRQEASRVLGQPPIEITSQENIQVFGQLSELDLDLIQSMAEEQTTLEKAGSTFSKLSADRARYTRGVKSVS